ncbi:MAG: class I SAM-dependent methyltransferase [Opitutales bacterium]
MRLTEQAHALILPFLIPGGIAVDATAGNGHDTAFLAKTLGPGGRVHAFDIQQTAVEATRQRVHTLTDAAEVVIHPESHERMGTLVPTPACAILFNLGYLPGGQKTITTRTDSTLRALDQALERLDAPGILTLIAYPGHEAGVAETRAVAAWFNRQCHPERIVGGIDPDAASPSSAPRLFYLQRLT